MRLSLSAAARALATMTNRTLVVSLAKHTLSKPFSFISVSDQLVSLSFTFGSSARARAGPSETVARGSSQARKFLVRKRE
jgi:hypothetical protein